MVSRHSSHSTIKNLVFDLIHQTKGKVSYETVTAEVKKHFPKSKWSTSHWTWYRSQIRKGAFKQFFSERERANLGLDKRTDQAGQRKVKRVGDALLNHIRSMVQETAGDDPDLRFKLNRWIYARLQQDDRTASRLIKKELWDLGIHHCQDQKCRKKFRTLKGVEIHRIDSSHAYSLENCELLCKPCHQKLHS